MEIFLMLNVHEAIVKIKSHVTKRGFGILRRH